MTLQELISWHTAQRAGLADQSSTEAAHHFDAAALLQWCVELPSAGGPHSRAFAFERLMEQSTLEIQAIDSGLFDHMEDADVMATDRAFWVGVSRNAADMAGGVIH